MTLELTQSLSTEADYRAALIEIDGLPDAPEGTEEFDRLHILTTLVERYEAKHYPIGPPSPAAAAEYEREKRGLTPRDPEPVLGIRERVGRDA